MNRHDRRRIDSQLKKGTRMKANLTSILMDINDEKPMTLQDGQPATLRAIIQQALAGPVKGDETTSEDERYKLYRLGRRCKADDVHFSASEVTLVLTRVSKFFLSAYVYGQVKDMLDPPETTQTASLNGTGAHHELGA